MVIRHGHVPEIDSSSARKQRIAAAVDVVQDLAVREQSQYGVTTGFGGSGKIIFPIPTCHNYIYLRIFSDDPNEENCTLTGVLKGNSSG